MVLKPWKGVPESRIPFSEILGWPHISALCKLWLVMGSGFDREDQFGIRNGLKTSRKNCRIVCKRTILLA